MKPIGTLSDSSWTEARLLTLIHGREQESLTLEFKACDALSNTESKKSELSKDVAAFANSAGGAIIYGIRETSNVAIALDSGFDPTEVSKEWLENVINSRIQRRIDGLLVIPVHLDTTNPGRYAYVVEIPQSVRAPHQSSDKRFYKRFNFQAVPMEEYEVRDAGNRGSSPELDIVFSPRSLPTNEADPKPAGAWSRIDLRPSITNLSSAPANYASIHLYVDSRLAVSSGSGLVPTGEILSANLEGALVTASVHHMNWGVPGKMPIFEGINFSLMDGGQCFEIRPPSYGKYFLGWKVFCPRMVQRTGFASLDLNEISCAIRPNSVVP